MVRVNHRVKLTIKNKKMNVEEKVAQAQKDLEKRDKKGKFRKETWRERFGAWRIIWIFGWGVLAGASWLYVYVSYPDIFEPKTIIIVNNAEAKTTQPEEEPMQTYANLSKSGVFYTYNAEESQTDGNPYRTASGKIVKDGIVANNCLDFGTKVDVEGVGVLEVQDRMNSRYGCDDFDVFRENPEQNFKKTLNYKIL